MTVKSRRFTFDVFDGVAPVRGAVLLSARVAYRIIESRPVDSRLWRDRWSIQVRRLAHDEPITDEYPVMNFVPYAKGEGPSDVARQVGCPL